MNERLGGDIIRSANRFLGYDFVEEVRSILPGTGDLLLPYAVYHYEIEPGTPAAAWYLRYRHDRLDASEREFLEAQLASWLSIWHVREVQANHVVLRDLLTGEERTVLASRFAESAVKDSGVLARVVDFDGVSVMSGFHPDLLPREVMELVVDEMREGLSQNRFAPDDLRAEDDTLHLIDAWKEAAQAMLSRPRVLRAG